MRLSELAELTGARVEGATDDVEILGAAGLDEAGEGHVTFLANPRYTPRVNTTRASAIYLSEEATTEKQIAILRVKDPYLAYTRARLQHLYGDEHAFVFANVPDGFKVSVTIPFRAAAPARLDPVTMEVA